MTSNHTFICTGTGNRIAHSTASCNWESKHYGISPVFSNAINEIDIGGLIELGEMLKIVKTDWKETENSV